DAFPGVSSAGYGPAVGQPVIRGVGGYRADVMQNGMTIGDIAATGGDHTNALSLYDTERVEVLKGPAALRYGAFAATGVVNSFNRHLNADTDEGTDVLFGFGDNADESITAFFTRQGRFSLSAISQGAGNITIPTHAESDHQVAVEQEHAEEEGDPIPAHPAHGETTALST
ncbi:MAG: TonB-dependent receptor plug domain-containing protein, partial [Parvibaculales bacterium]